MQDADGKEDGACHQESPHEVGKAVEDMRQPCCKGTKSYDVSHDVSL